MSLRVGSAVVAGALLLGFATPAAAGGDEAAAEALFVQARAEMAKGNYAKACPMLEESYRIVAGIGTKFNLGDCYEKLGLTASAWASFRDAAAASKLAGQKERESAAKDRAARLEDKLCRLTIQIAPQSAITVTRDGDAIGVGQWGVPLPIDPGSHLVEAKAPGKNAWSTTISTTGCPSTASVSVPALTDAPLPPPPPSAAQRKEEEPKVQPRSNPARSILTVSSLGLGVAGLGLGSYFGVRAWSLRDDSNSNGHCTGNSCDDRGSALRDQSRQFGTGATISFIAGGALLALGIVLWLTDTPAAKAR